MTTKDPRCLSITPSEYHDFLQIRDELSQIKQTLADHEAYFRKLLEVLGLT